jgi:hypothetical protein
VSDDDRKREITFIAPPGREVPRPPNVRTPSALRKVPESEIDRNPRAEPPPGLSLEDFRLWMARHPKVRLCADLDEPTLVCAYLLRELGGPLTPEHERLLQPPD